MSASLRVPGSQQLSGPIEITGDNKTILAILEAKGLRLDGTLEIKLNGETVPPQNLDSQEVQDGDRITATDKVKAG